MQLRRNCTATSSVWVSGPSKGTVAGHLCHPVSPGDWGWFLSLFPVLSCAVSAVLLSQLSACRGGGAQARRKGHTARTEIRPESRNSAPIAQAGGRHPSQPREGQTPMSRCGVGDSLRCSGSVCFPWVSWVTGKQMTFSHTISITKGLLS